MPKIQFDRGDTVYLEYGIQQEVPTQDFLVANQLLVPAGNYTWSRIEAGFETTSKEPVEIGGSAAWSGYYGGSRTTVSGEPPVATSSQLALSRRRAVERHQRLIPDVWKPGWSLVA